MAQTIAEIKKVMTDNWMENPSIQVKYELIAGKTFEEEFSPVSLESILFSVVAFLAWTLQMLFDLHRTEVGTALANMKAHTLRWYASKALAFQLGFNLVPDDDVYDNTDVPAVTVEAARIVKYAAVVEVAKGLRIKVVGEVAGDFTPLTAPELAAFRPYMGRIKDAGVRLYIDSNPADSLRLSLKIYYDPLVLTASGARLDGTAATPVQDAIKAFLRYGMPFNGLFVTAKLIDALQAVEGVVIPHLVSATARYGALPYAVIDAEYQPDAGWLRLVAPADLTLQFLPHEPV